MAIQGRFEADFALFYDAVQKAEVSLRSMETGAGKVETSLNRMVDSFSGRKIISDAQLMAEAVDRIGGVSKLTEAELARVSSTAAEAAAKMRAMGVDVPPGMQKIADQAKGIDTTASTMIGTLQSLAGAFGIAFSVQQIAQFAGEVIAFGGHLDDLSKASGLSTDALQALGIKGEEVGIDMETIANSTTQLARRIAGDDASAYAAIGKLGLSFTTLKGLSIDDMLVTVMNRLTQVGSESDKAKLAFDLFGRAGVGLLAILRDNKGGLEGVIQAAKDAGLVLGTESVATIDRADDAWTRLGRAVKVSTGEVIASMLDLKDNFMAAFEVQDKVFDQMTRIGSAHNAAAHDVELHSNATKDATVHVDLLANRLTQLRTDAMVPLSAAQKASIVELTEWGVNQKEVAELVKTTETAVHRYIEAHKQAAEETKKFAAAMEEMNSVGAGWKGTIETINGDIAAAVRYYLDAGVAQDKLATAYGLSAAQVKALASEQKDAVEQTKLEAASVEEVTKLWDEYDQVIASGSESAYDKAAANIDKWYNDTIAKNQAAKKDTADFYDAIAALDDAKYAHLLANTLADDVHTREHFERLAQQAQVAYDFAMAHADSYAADWIQKLEDAATAARLSADTWGTAFVENGDKAKAAVDGVTASVRTATDAVTSFSKGMDLVAQGKGTMSGTVAGTFDWTQYTNSLMKASSGVGTVWADLPKFADGGMGDFGAGTPVMLHGKEAVVPLDGGGGLGNTNITIYVNGTAEDVARKVMAEITRTMKIGRKWPAA